VSSATTRVEHQKSIVHGDGEIEALCRKGKRNGAVASESTRRSREGREKGCGQGNIIFLTDRTSKSVVSSSARCFLDLALGHSPSQLETRAQLRSTSSCQDLTLSQFQIELPPTFYRESDHHIYSWTVGSNTFSFFISSPTIIVKAPAAMTMTKT
jgi:hypothetical protein